MMPRLWIHIQPFLITWFPSFRPALLELSVVCWALNITLFITAYIRRKTRDGTQRTFTQNRKQNSPKDLQTQMGGKIHISDYPTSYQTILSQKNRKLHQETLVQPDKTESKVFHAMIKFGVTSMTQDIKNKTLKNVWSTTRLSIRIVNRCFSSHLFWSWRLLCPRITLPWFRSERCIAFAHCHVFCTNTLPWQEQDNFT